jgi:YcxB-like protein
MVVKTKKHELNRKFYRRVCLRNVIKAKWWIPASIFLGIVALNLLLNLVYRNYWIYLFAPLGAWLYYGFWWVQFTAAPDLPQFKTWFKKYLYEITSQQILVKERENANQAMLIKWEMIKSAEKQKDGYILFISVAQFIHLPFKIFASENDMRFLESILRRKKLLPDLQAAILAKVIPKT